MAWYPGATKRELQPESDAQPAIRPTQFILHSIAAPWTAKRTYEYWRDSTNLESHFAVGYEGDLAQFIGTHTRADATGAANLRPDGTGAVSLESASNLNATDRWTAAQVEAIVGLAVWLHEEEGIPLRICRDPDDPGFGHHRQFATWNPNGHSCPGDARVKQFREEIFPAIVARAAGKTTAPDTTTPATEKADPMPEVLTESSATDATVPAGRWTLIAMAADSALLQGPCTYSVTAYATVTGKPGTRVDGRFQDLTLKTKRASMDLPMHAGTIGPDGRLDVALTRPGKLTSGEQLKVELLADNPVTITYRVLRGLVWR